MIDKESQSALASFIGIAKEEYDAILKTIKVESYEKAVELILDAEKRGNRVHITGIGKPGHVANYIASLLSSTGTPTYFLHGTEAVHGSCGQLIPGDVVICISNSGETIELKSTVEAVKNNGCKVISVAGNPDSWLAKQGDAFLYAGIKAEGDLLNRAPRASILAEILVLQGLSIVLQSIRKITPQEYVKWHPGGTLGQLRENEN
ncbi:KpsF/GutQ family sugar-phosphate isomerase [Ruminiclostridium cellobioparum]|uniref:Putative sugar phosphate isomerase involved in capsule formation n=1 Tax=Ruminiclostridium cellobioparum subsp. termitidis CT1112 TaxID=1195236 RepID=S0FSV4_RUMCE|nr:SIS domain-containing protein [Ruminiclostridium cellobioparum]EMS73401.1 putative sugar phosphate isomerase involved in capsule formation [Ruminiclostridium cellobioparum subsp. termitidis CT1112]